MAEKINWQQVGQDFQQKYENTFCRYTSPVNKSKEVFHVLSVEPHVKSPPDLVLYNEKVGEIYLKYDTEAELDFSFPEIGYFQHNRSAMRIVRNYERQYKKGICSATIHVIFPYDEIWRTTSPFVSETYVTSAFKPRVIRTINEAISELGDTKVSMTLTNRLALGIGLKDEILLWHDNHPIGIIKDREIELKTPLFEQEVRDYLRQTGEHVRAIV